MKVNELLEMINGFAPLDTACEWDNCGLIVGDKDCEITSVYLTLDADMQALSEAKALGCNTVVSHHPIIFSPVSKLTAENPAYHYIREGIPRLIWQRAASTTALQERADLKTYVILCLTASRSAE